MSDIISREELRRIIERQPRSICMGLECETCPIKQECENIKQGDFWHMANIRKAFVSYAYENEDDEIEKQYKTLSEDLARHEDWVNKCTSRTASPISFSNLTIHPKMAINLYKGRELFKADFSNSILDGLVFQNSNMFYAIFDNACIANCDFSGTNCRRTSFQEVDGSYTSFEHAYLEKADFSFSNLSNTDFSNANLAGTCFKNTNLSGANFKGANLKGVNFCEAVLIDANFENATIGTTTMGLASVCPETGSFNAYKCALRKNEIPEVSLKKNMGIWSYIRNYIFETVIVKLHIPENARRSSATTRKCRCDVAYVADITDLYGETHYDSAFSRYNMNFEYRVGEVINVPDFNEDRWRECAEGIHFFITKDEAIQYAKETMNV